MNLFEKKQYPYLDNPSHIPRLIYIVHIYKILFKVIGNLDIHIKIFRMEISMKKQNLIMYSTFYVIGIILGRNKTHLTKTDYDKRHFKLSFCPFTCANLDVTCHVTTKSLYFLGFHLINFKCIAIAKSEMYFSASLKVN